jgi:hypothetical protein
MKKPVVATLMLAGLIGVPGIALADTVYFSDPSGLSASAEFNLINPTTLEIILTNTSTAAPADFDAAGLLLTTVAFNLPGTTTITGGTAYIGAGSTANGFVAPAGGNISQEWGWGDAGPGDCCAGYPTLVNWVSTLTAGTNQFQAGSIDASGLNGPSFGLSNGLAPLGGLESINNTAVFTLNLSGTVSDLSFLQSGSVVEFGSDRAFVPNQKVPEPATLLLFGIGLIGAAAGRRRRRAA